MYHPYFGLSRCPFDVTPDPTLIYFSHQHREALATIVYGVECRKGFVVCTGEVGMGKTTLVRAYFDMTNSRDLQVIYIFTPHITPPEIIRYLCTELGTGGPADGGFSGVQAVQMKLLELYRAGRTVVLIIDEAQVLSIAALEILRLLSNFETASEKLIQIVLVGQPELDHLLARRDLRQVNQRVTLRARLHPFSVAESVRYLEHRLVATGAPGLEHIMTQQAAMVIARAAGGIPRKLNTLADNVLIAGFGADERPIKARLATRVVRELMSQAYPPATERRGLLAWFSR